mmetsp:Transcript_7214/g.20313  ORF Transcript_7214/g.20313 Transcript_7214/m.20313 type:complete len:235 (-) Transcript_7214:1793-2497(-)
MISSSPSRPSLLPPPSRSRRSSTGRPDSATSPAEPGPGPACTQSASARFAASLLWSPLRQLPELEWLRQKPAAYHLQMPSSNPARPPAPSPTKSWPLPPLPPLPRFPPLPPFRLPLPFDASAAKASTMASCRSCLALTTSDSNPRMVQIRAFDVAFASGRVMVSRAPDSAVSLMIDSPPDPITRPTASSGTSMRSSTRGPSSKPRAARLASCERRAFRSSLSLADLSVSPFNSA